MTTSHTAGLHGGKTLSAVTLRQRDGLAQRDLLGKLPRLARQRPVDSAQGQFAQLDQRRAGRGTLAP